MQDAVFPFSLLVNAMVIVNDIFARSWINGNCLKILWLSGLPLLQLVAVAMF